MPVYIEGMRNLLFKPHEGLSGPDYILDSNSDNNIDHIEMEMARTTLLWDLAKGLFWNFGQGMADPWVEVPDFNNDTLIQLNEIMVLKDYIFHMPELKESHDLNHPVDRLADENKNGRVETEEYNNFFIQILTKIGKMPLIIQKEQDFYVEDFQVREWADVNHDKTIDNKEIISVAFTLFEAIMEPIQVASNPVLRYFDLNRDRIVDFKESKRASQFDFVRKSASHVSILLMILK